MSGENKHNLHYFEGVSMRELYNIMDDWQKTNQKRFLSTNIQQDQGKFCCIALSNPTEVIICNGVETGQAKVGNNHRLYVDNNF